MTSAPVPSKDYARQFAALSSELLPELERVLANEAPILGASVQRFEREFADYCGAAHGIGVGNGTDALLLSLRALGVGPGDEVVTAANTFVATIAAIHLAGARPVLVDPDPATLVLTATGVRAALSPATRAVIAVHLYGRLAPMQALGELCRERGVHLLEDAAQAHGARLDPGSPRAGRAAGALGVCGAFSFHPSKNLGAFGDGGMILTDDEALAEELRVLRNLGKRGKYEVRRLAPNSKLDTLQAALLSVKLPHLDEWNARRRALARRYDAALAGLDALQLPAPAVHAEEHVHHLYVVRTAARDALRAHLGAHGIRAGLHYPIPPHLQELDVDLGYRAGELPVTERAAREGLTLPLGWELSEDEVDRVAACVRGFFAEARA